jgi:hypothetical protein
LVVKHYPSSKKLHIMLTRLALILMLAGFVLASCSKDENCEVHCTSEVRDTSLDITGIATLVRDDNKISMTFYAEGLTPGNAYTIWWVIWNKPENCAIPFACDLDDLLITQLVEVDVPFAAGLVVGTDGVGSFAASRMEGDTTGSTNHLFNAPPFALEDARTAEIHLLLRDHGPAIPGQVQEQISTFLGGCDVYACYEPMFAIFSPDCGL